MRCAAGRIARRRSSSSSARALGRTRERAVDGGGGGARTRKLSEARARCVDGERRRAGGGRWGAREVLGLVRKGSAWVGSWSFHTTTNGYITYSMSEHGMCTPTDPRFHKKREDFRYVYTCLTVVCTNSLKKVRPAPPRDVDVSSPSRRVARPRRDVDVATDRARASPLASHPSSRPRRPHSRARIPRARAGGDESRPPARDADDDDARARAPSRSWSTTNDSRYARLARARPASETGETETRAVDARTLRRATTRDARRRARASTNAREREIRTSIGAWTMI